MKDVAETVNDRAADLYMTELEAETITFDDNILSDQKRGVGDKLEHLNFDVAKGTVTIVSSSIEENDRRGRAVEQVYYYTCPIQTFEHNRPQQQVFDDIVNVKKIPAVAARVASADLDHEQTTEAEMQLLKLLKEKYNQ